MKNFLSKIKSGTKNVVANIKKAIVNLKDKVKNVLNKIRNKIRNKNKQVEEKSRVGSQSIVSNEKINDASNERQTIVKETTIPTNSSMKFRTTSHDTIVVPIIMNKTQNNTISQRHTNNIVNQDDENYSQVDEEIESTSSIENAERIVSIDIKENVGIVEFETITGKKYQKNIVDILNEKKNIYKNWNINKKCNDFAKNKIQELRLRRRLNPVVISTLNNEEDIDNYIKCVRDTEKIWFNLEHDLINSQLKGKNARLMKRVGKHELKIGAKVQRKENLIERMMKKIKAKNKGPEEMTEELEDIEKANNELNVIEEQIVEDINQVEDKTKPIQPEVKVERKTEVEQTIGIIENIEDTNKKGIISKTKEAIESMAKESAEKAKQKKAEEEQIRKQRVEQRKKAEEEKIKLEEKKMAERTEFNKRYNDYNVLARGILGRPAKRNIQDIRNDIVHNDLYDMTSDDDATKGIATFRTGHRLAILPTKKKEAERLLKTAISILNNEDVLAKDGSLIETLQNAYMDLGNLYRTNGNFDEAEAAFIGYMNLVKKEKIERYDPLILEARNDGKKLIELDYWISYRNKTAAGRKSLLKLLCDIGKEEEAKEFYKKLLESSKIYLTNEEYELCIDTKCFEDGQYIKIIKGIAHRNTITGSEDLFELKERVAEQIVADLKRKQNESLEK